MLSQWKQCKVALETAQQPLEPGHIWIGQTTGTGHKFKLKGPITRAKATVPADAIRTGQPTFADDQYASSVIWEDLTGGVGVINMDEKESPDRFSDSSLHTRTKNLITLGPKQNAITFSGAALNGPVYGAVTLQGYTYLGGGSYIKRLVYQRDGTIYTQYFDTGTNTWVSSGGTEYAAISGDGMISGPPVVWKGYVYFPAGESGFVRIAPTGTYSGAIAQVTCPTGFVRRATIFDEDLYFTVETAPGTLSSSATAYSTDSTSTTITVAAGTATSRGSIDTFEAITGIVVGKNLSGDPAPWVATNNGLYIHDYWTQKFYRLFSFPDGDLNNGRNVTEYDGSIWHGLGTNAVEITNGARVIRGPNTGDGVPTTLQSRPVAFENSYTNFLVAGFTAGDSPSTVSWVGAYNRRGFHVLAQGSVTASATAYADSFDSADSTTSMDGGPFQWTYQSGIWGIKNNQAYRSTASGAFDIATVSSGFSDCVIEATLDGRGSAATYENQSVVFRFSDTSNYWRLNIPRTASSVAALPRMTLQKVVAGVASAASVASLGPTIIGSYGPTRIKIVLSGSIINVYLNGVLAMVATDSFNSTATKHGFGTAEAAATPLFRWDDLAVYQTNAQLDFTKFVAAGAATKPPLIIYNLGSTVYYLKVFDSTDNPNQFLTTDYATAGTLILPKFDADLANLQKNAVSVEIRTLNCDASNTVTVSYATDDSASYTQMYTSAGAQTAITTNGLTTLYFDTDKLGTLFYNIRLKVVLAGQGGTTPSPAVVFVKIRYERIFDTLYSYAGVIDFENGSIDGQLSAGALAAWDALVESKQLVRFAYQSGHAASGDSNTRVGRIRVSGGQTGLGGTDRGGFAQFTILEITPQ